MIGKIFFFKHIFILVVLYTVTFPKSACLQEGVYADQKNLIEQIIQTKKTTDFYGSDKKLNRTN
jgi:hypothetical protein